MRKLLACIVLLLASHDVCRAAFEVRRLRVEHMENPQAVDVRVPRMSWVNECPSGERGQRQTAYRIVVAVDTADMARGVYMWDSGKVKSGESHLVPYAGPSLAPMTTYHWKVMTWDAKGKPSPWSETARWTMGLPDDKWTARWISAPDYGGRAPLMRKAFKVRSGLSGARMVICGLGYHELYVNGARVDDDCLVPNISNYAKRRDLDKHAIALDGNFSGYRVLYLGRDVLGSLREGDNVLGVVLGNGFYIPDKGIASTFGQLCLRMQLHLTYSDGSTEVVQTDDTWQARPSAIMYDGIFQGELYDARMETPGWATTDAPREGWDQAKVVSGPDGAVMSAQTSPSDKVTEVLQPVKFKAVGEKAYEVDFGKEISGWIRLRDIRGKAGDTVRVDFECESPQGIQRYVLKGGGAEEYAPRFTWFVFRRARITGATLSWENVQAEAVNTDVPIDAEFVCSNPLYNEINAIWRRSQTDNMHGCAPSDCPHRERLPYTGDGQAAAETVMLNYDAAAFYAKWLRDIRDSQNAETGYVPNGSPWEPGCGGGVAWGAAMCVIPWQYFVQYGDTATLRSNYDAMKAQMGHMYTWLTPEGTMFQKKTNHGTNDVSYWLNLGDWCPPADLPREELVHTFYCWLCSGYTARAASVLGHTDDAAFYAAKADDLWQAFHRAFYDPAAKSYGKGGSNVYALHMGVPADRLDDVRSTLRREIMEDNKGHINTGFLATKYFFETLSDAGLDDVAHAVMNKRDFPSYGWWIEQGATTTWEQWDGGNSHNHPMFGSGLTWFYRRLAGVEADESMPGYRHFVVDPRLPEGPFSVRYSKQTPYGRLSLQVVQDAAGRQLEVTVPVGSECTLKMPLANGILESGKPLRKAKGIGLVPSGNDSIYVLLGQGTYSFEIPSAQCPPRGEAAMQVVDRALSNASAQALVLAKAMEDRKDLLPRTYERGEYRTETCRWWTSGFFPGTLWLLSEHFPDNAQLRRYAELFTKRVEPVRHDTTTHDVGFMLQCSYGQAFRITGDSAYLPPLSEGAAHLAARFMPAPGVILSWNRSRRWRNPVIIDNMMNLELLEEVGKRESNQRYLQIADSHATTTMRNHYRNDFSTWHVVDYDEASGEVIKRTTAQGCADDSDWARGQAWGLYGYVMMYRETSDSRYLQHAVNVARYLTSRTNQPADAIPYWDYDAPDIPFAMRDASSAAIMASALLDLAQYTKDSESRRWLRHAWRIILSLSSPAYTAPAGENGGFILMHCTGNLPGNSEMDVPLTYADYYYVEALLKMQRHLSDEP